MALRDLFVSERRQLSAVAQIRGPVYMCTQVDWRISAGQDMVGQKDLDEVEGHLQEGRKRPMDKTQPNTE